MAQDVDFLLLGGGLASATAAQALRDGGTKGSILIVSEEDVAPYNRPPLSKEVLLGTIGRERLLILNEAEAEKQRIELLLDCRAQAVDPIAHVVATTRTAIHFGKLLIATGATPRCLEVPGKTLTGVHTLRSLADAEALRDVARRAQRAVVVGAGFLGLEVAGTLTRLGLKVTIIEQEPILLRALQAAPVSEHILGHYRERGVTVLLGETVASVIGSDGRVASVVTGAGKELPCELVVVTIGVDPNVAFLEGSGIAVDNGVCVDRFLRSSVPDVYAAGDVANICDRPGGPCLRVEHWDSAIKQGRAAATNMLGAELVYDEVSYFYCDTLDFSFEVLGKPDGADRVVERGSPASRDYVRLFLKDNVATALLSVGRPATETKAVESLIRYRINLEKFGQRLLDPAFSWDQIPSQTVLVLQGGGAMGAFEAGVVRALEEDGIFPDIVAGVSIGAYNGAIIAGNPRNPAAALEAFWDELAVILPPWAWTGATNEALSSWYNLTFGSPQMFRPRWFDPTLSLNSMPVNWTSFYDTQPAKSLLARFVDFASLRKSPVRLLVTAIDVESGELQVFDSHSHDLTADHIVASGSLPPGFPWTTIEGRHYWDGGIISNSPLEQVAARCGLAGKRVFIVDLFAKARALPTNIVEVLARRDELVYAERVNKDVHSNQLIEDVHGLVEEMLGYMDPGVAAVVKQRPRFIQVMGNRAPFEITRFERKAASDEPLSRDFDFSERAIKTNRENGYARAREVLMAQHPMRPA